MGKKKFALGVALGAIAGAVTGWLTAPKSGKETREDLKKKAGEVKAATGEKVSEVKENLKSFGKDAEKNAKVLKKRTENAVTGAKEGFNKPAK